jgi:SagB-type dehydrogenase family enzyme
VLRRRPYPGGEILYRAAACTGALYHIDAYVVCSDVEGLAAGVHHFGPHDFALRTLRAGNHRALLVAATGDEPHAADAPILVVLTSTFWRNAWKYRARTYRHCFWDAGTLLANLLAVTAALGVPAHVITGFIDDKVARLLDIDQTREAPLAVLALGADEPPAPPASSLPRLGLATLPLSREEIDYPLIREAHVASSLATATAVREWRTAVAEAARLSAVRADVALKPLPAAAIPAPIEAVIAQRGSTRRFPREAIPLARFATILHLSTRPVSLDVVAPVELHVIVNAVDGLAPGAYRCGPDGRTLELLRAVANGSARRMSEFGGYVPRPEAKTGRRRG